MLNFFKGKKEIIEQPQEQSKTIHEPTGNRCPYCHAVIDKEPKGKFKCPSCGGEIHIQKSGKKINLLTKEQRENLNAQRKLQAAENRYFLFFDGAGASRDYLVTERNNYFKKMGKGANYPDLTLQVAHALLQKFIKSGNFSEMSTIYFSMARMYRQEGRPFFDLLQEGNKWRLYKEKELLDYFEGSEVSIVRCKDSCPACCELDGKRFTIDEALEQMPLPVKGCTHDGGWCRCTYVYHIKRIN